MEIAEFAGMQWYGLSLFRVLLIVDSTACSILSLVSVSCTKTLLPVVRMGDTYMHTLKMFEYKTVSFRTTLRVRAKKA